MMTIFACKSMLFENVLVKWILYVYSIQEAQLMLTTGATRLAVSPDQQTCYHLGSVVATFR